MKAAARTPGGVTVVWRPLALCSVFVLALATGNCGGSETDVVEPTGPTDVAGVAAVQAIMIVPAVSTLKLGATERFSISVELGSGIPPSGPMPFWSSTNPSVIVVDQNGSATAVSLGEAVLRVSFRSKIADLHLRVEE